MIKNIYVSNETDFLVLKFDIEYLLPTSLLYSIFFHKRILNKNAVKSIEIRCYYGIIVIINIGGYMDTDKAKREIILSKEMINTKVDELGKIISEDYKDKNLLVISLLKGSFIFTADLVRSLSIPVRIEFMITSSYGHSEESTGHLKIEKDIDVDDLKDYDVLIVDDIVDSGITMYNILDLIGKRNPKSLRSCTLLDKPSRRMVEIDPDYCGFSIEDKFIVGYGLNYKDHFRNIDHVFAFVED